jgi:hypothetical protein
MATQSPSNRAALRTFVVVALSLLIIVAGGLDLRQIWVPLGIFGYDTNNDLVVISVDNGSPAAKAGMQVGDTVDLQMTPAQFRFSVANGYTLVPGQSATFGLIHRGVRRLVTLTATPAERIHFLAAYLMAVVGIAVLWVALGAALVLLRPSLTTWGFFIYCLALNPFGYAIAPVLFPFPWPYIELSVFYFIAAGATGLTIFALCFLNEPLKGWRLSALRLVPWLFVALFIWELFKLYQQTWIGGPMGELISRIDMTIYVVTALAGLYLLVDTYVRARGVDRQRIRWVVVAFVLNLTTYFVEWLLVDYVLSTPDWVFRVLQLSNIILPLAVAYAVIKYRVIDVSFVVSRALVYGTLTTLLAGVFYAIDWFFTDYLRVARFGTVVEVGAAIAVGIWFKAFHMRLDALIDATFFRRRHKAEIQLARVAAAMPLATTMSAVAECLVSEPFQALALASAALFRRTSGGVYVREDSEGWDSSDLSKLDDSDQTLLMLAQAEGGPLSLYEHRWRTEGVPTGPARPVLALPIIVRRELAAIVFYGSHIHGEGLDPDEIKAIAGLAPGAAAAYDHLEAEAMKRRLEAMAAENESLRTQLAEAQIQPA